MTILIESNACSVCSAFDAAFAQLLWPLVVLCHSVRLGFMTHLFKTEAQRSQDRNQDKTQYIRGQAKPKTLW